MSSAPQYPISAVVESTLRAAQAGRALASRVRALPPPMQPQYQHVVVQAANAVAALEKQASEAVTRALGRPVPAPDPDRAGAWSEEIHRQVGGILAQSPVRVGPAFVQSADQLAGQIQQVTQSIGASMAPSSPGSAGPATQVPAPYRTPALPPPPGLATVQIPGVGPVAPRTALIFSAIGQIVDILGTGTLAYLTYRGAKNAAQGAPPAEGDLAAVLAWAQSALDADVPGAMFTPARRPDGGWMAHVRRGTRVIGRAEGATIGEAAQGAVDQAVASAALKADVTIEVIEKIDEAQGKPPRRKKAASEPEAVEKKAPETVEAAPGQ